MNKLLALLAVLTIAVSVSSEAQSQMYGFGTFGGVNGYNGNHINYYGGCGVAPDPRLGYCLENDCFCGGNNGCFGGSGGYGYGNGYGNGCGGCGNGCNNSRGTVIRVTTRRGNAEPEVRVIYPQSGGCGCENGTRSTPSTAKATARTMPRSNRYSAAHRIPRATASARRPSGSAKALATGNTASAKKVKYRYQY